MIKRGRAKLKPFDEAYAIFKFVAPERLKVKPIGSSEKHILGLDKMLYSIYTRNDVSLVIDYEDVTEYCSIYFHTKHEVAYQSLVKVRDLEAIAEEICWDP